MTGLSLALVVGAVGCSGDDEPESKRRCAAVQPSKLSDLVESRMRLERAQEGIRSCRFVSQDGRLEVILGVDGPVEAGTAELLLTEPEPLPDVGDEAWITTTGAPLDARAVVRVDGALLTVDLGAPRLSNRARRELVTAIATEGAGSLPEMEVREAGGPRGEEACDRYEEDRVAIALGGVPTVQATAPPGSCRLTVDAIGLTVNVTVLVEDNASDAGLDAIVAGIEDPVEVTVRDEHPARWVPSGETARTGGQLYVLDDDRILQVAILGDGFDPGIAQELATALAGVALDEA